MHLLDRLESTVELLVVGQSKYVQYHYIQLIHPFDRANSIFIYLFVCVYVQIYIIISKKAFDCESIVDRAQQIISKKALDCESKWNRGVNPSQILCDLWPVSLWVDIFRIQPTPDKLSCYIMNQDPPCKVDGRTSVLKCIFLL